MTKIQVKRRKTELIQERELLNAEYLEYKKYVLFYIPKYEFSDMDKIFKICNSSENYFANSINLQTIHLNLKKEFINSLAKKSANEVLATLCEFMEKDNIIHKLAKNTYECSQLNELRE